MSGALSPCPWPAQRSEDFDGWASRLAAVEQRLSAVVAEVDGLKASLLPTAARAGEKRRLTTCSAADLARVSLAVPPVRAETQETTGANAADEEEQYSQRSSLYRFWEGDWKHLGVGEAKLLLHRESSMVRFELRHEESQSVLANHFVVGMPPFCDLKLNAGSEKTWVWKAEDFAGDEPGVRDFALKFANAELAHQFKEAFERARDDGASLAGASAHPGGPQGRADSASAWRDQGSPSVVPVASGASVETASAELLRELARSAKELQLRGGEHSARSKEFIRRASTAAENLQGALGPDEQKEQQESGAWSNENSFRLCSDGDEGPFKDKATFYAKEMVSSVSGAVEMLNSGSLNAGGESWVAVFSEGCKEWYVLHEPGLRDDALEHFGCSDDRAHRVGKGSSSPSTRQRALRSAGQAGPAGATSEALDFGRASQRIGQALREDAGLPQDAAELMREMADLVQHFDRSGGGSSLHEQLRTRRASLQKVAEVTDRIQDAHELALEHEAAARVCGAHPSQGSRSPSAVTAAERSAAARLARNQALGLSDATPPQTSGEPSPPRSGGEREPRAAVAREDPDGSARGSARQLQGILQEARSELSRSDSGGVLEVREELRRFKQEVGAQLALLLAPPSTGLEGAQTLDTARTHPPGVEDLIERSVARLRADVQEEVSQMREQLAHLEGAWPRSGSATAKALMAQDMSGVLEELQGQVGELARSQRQLEEACEEEMFRRTSPARSGSLQERSIQRLQDDVETVQTKVMQLQLGQDKSEALVEGFRSMLAALEARENSTREDAKEAFRLASTDVRDLQREFARFRGEAALVSPAQTLRTPLTSPPPTWSAALEGRKQASALRSLSPTGGSMPDVVQEARDVREEVALARGQVRGLHPRGGVQEVPLSLSPEQFDRATLRARAIALSAESVLSDRSRLSNGS